MSDSHTPRTMHARMRIPVGIAALLGMLRDVVWPMHARRRSARVAATVPGTAVVTLSVRSAFAALIEALDLQPGDEIAMSCITIGDMALLPDAFGVRVVPVDVDSRSLAPCPHSLQRALTPRTRMFVAAHLFGARPSLTECAELARRHGALVVCDAAQGFGSDQHGAAPWRSDVDADVTLLSFGPIKSATALGGGVAVLRDADLARRMEDVQRAWPRRARRTQLARLARYSVLALLTRPAPYAMVLARLTRRGLDHDATLKTKVRNFGAIDTPDELRAAVSVRPDAALATTVVRRLHAPPTRALRRSRAIGSMLVEQLGDRVPGAGDHPHAHWLVPLRCDSEAQRQHVRTALHGAGFDTAPLEQTNMVDLSAGTGPETDQSVLANVLLLPSLYGMRPRAARRLLTVIRSVLEPST